MVCALLSHAYHVTCHVTLSCECDTFLHSLLCSKSKIKEKEKEKKRNINNDLAILPSHDIFPSMNGQNGY